MGARHGPARRREPDRPLDPDLRARRAAPLRRHQHVPQGALCRERARRRQVRRRGARHPVRQRHHLPPRHPLRAAGHPADLGALHALQLRARRRPARADDAVRRRRRVHHPGQPREELRPDHAAASRTSPPAAPCRSCWAATIRSAFPACAASRSAPRKKIGIVHFDRHIDIQEKDLDERMHTTPWYWATNLPNVSPKNLVQVGIGGWQVPRYGVAGGAQAPDQRADHRATWSGWASRRPPRSRSSSPGTAPTRSTSQLRRRQRRLRLRPRHRLARARRLPAARGAEAAGPGRRRRASAASRWSRSARPTTPRTSPPCSATRVVVEVLGAHGRQRQARQPQGDHRQAGQPIDARRPCATGTHDHAITARPQPRRRGRAVQWQVPHRPPRRADAARRSSPSPTSTWSRPRSPRASPRRRDPTSFLRLAGVPFEGADGDGRRAVPAAGRARAGRPTWAR